MRVPCACPLQRTEENLAVSIALGCAPRTIHAIPSRHQRLASSLRQRSALKDAVGAGHLKAVAPMPLLHLILLRATTVPEDAQAAVAPTLPSCNCAAASPKGVAPLG